MWVVMRVQDWKIYPTRVLGLEVVVDPGKSTGYLPIYATKEDAEAEFPDGPFAQVQEIQS